VTWRDDAACLGRDPDLWFPDRSDSVTAKAAVTICAVCPVRGACHREALDHPETTCHGIWGGLTELERRRDRVEAGGAVHPYRGSGGPQRTHRAS
jgi:WhiB family redox-sensing transcriptional regulator